jgi:nucleoid-associated protein YgaU
VVADQSGQFAMIPPALPPGNHDLTLRVRQGDGRDVVSRRSVAVAVDPTPSAHAVATDALPRPSASGRADATVPAPPRLAAARATPDKPSPSSVVAPKLVTTTVSRGDSLWRISQRALGAGPRYVVIYHANMTRIRNPNLIYPGQVFVTPAR